MKIALVQDLPAGGALRFVRETTRRSNAAHEYILVTIAGDPVDAELRDAVTDVIEVSPRICPGRGGLARDLLTYAATQQRVAEAIDRGGFDVALVHPSRRTQAPPVLLHLRNTPSLYFMHEVRRRTYERGYRPWVETASGLKAWPRSTASWGVERWIAAVDRRATATATALAANSVFTAESIARIHGRDAHLCHPGVSSDASSSGPSDRSPYVLSVGALDPTKGHDRVLEALARLPVATRPPLVVVHERGDPRFEQILLDQAAATGTELILHRDATEAELADRYARASATVAAAPLEPLGLTVLESIAAGTPVVALRLGGYRETITHGVNGVLVDSTPCAIAKGLMSAMAMGRRASHEEIRGTLGQYWTWERCVEDLHRALEKTVER